MHKICNVSNSSETMKTTVLTCSDYFKLVIKTTNKRKFTIVGHVFYFSIHFSCVYHVICDRTPCDYIRRSDNLQINSVCHEMGRFVFIIGEFITRI